MKSTLATLMHCCPMASSSAWCCEVILPNSSMQQQPCKSSNSQSNNIAVGIVYLVCQHEGSSLQGEVIAGLPCEGDDEAGGGGGVASHENSSGSHGSRRLEHLGLAEAGVANNQDVGVAADDQVAAVTN